MDRQALKHGPQLKISSLVCSSSLDCIASETNLLGLALHSAASIDCSWYEAARWGNNP